MSRSTPTGSSLFTCPSCLLGVYRTLLNTRTSPAYLFATRSPSLLFDPLKQPPQRASHSTYASIAQGHHRRSLAKAIKATAKGKKLPWTAKRYRDGPKAWEIKSLRAREANKKHLDINPSKGDEIDKEMVQLRWTRDPLQIANIVQRGLRDGKRDEVLEVSRQAFSDGIPNVVSWNHIIDFDMERGQPKQAMAVYREVCSPDDTILRNCAD